MSEYENHYEEEDMSSQESRLNSFLESTIPTKYVLVLLGIITTIWIVSFFRWAWVQDMINDASKMWTIQKIDTTVGSGATSVYVRIITN